MKILDSYKKINKIINDASSVFITGHKDLDLDALGACLAMYYYVESFEKNVYLILDDKKKEAAVDKVIKEVGDGIHFVTTKKAQALKNLDSLLIVLDTNKEYLLQSIDLNSIFEKKLVIDHHEEGEETISNGELIIDIEASSTCEMVTEFLKLNKFMIDGNIATLLLSGIILDTNNYVLKTDSNTFYYSYYLTTCGASPTKVQYLLKQDLNKYIRRQKIITNVKIHNNVAIAKGANKEIYRREELAKAADSLLLFNGIEASFVIAKVGKNSVGISARSMGNINAGQVLSMFDGGGDANFAAAKIDSLKMNQVEEKLLNIIKLL